ncbi:MAG TPA: vanadium-dependent haloperoxidase [Kofleriaceae bacterium]
MKLLRHAQLGLASTLALFASCSAPTESDWSAASTNDDANVTTATVAFDFDNGNIATQLIIPTIVQESLKASPSGGDASVILYTTTMVTNGWFDAIAPYRPTVKGVYSNIAKRPSAESATNRNKNIAMAYAALRTLSVTMPKSSIAVWRSMLASVGLNPDNNSTDLTTAAGIGNAAGNAVIAARHHDGMNVFGDEGGKKYNLRPYEDTTGFVPTSTPYDLVDPSKWQALQKTGGYGLFTNQHFVTPQWGATRPYTHNNNDNDWNVPPPVNSDYNNRAAYIAQVDDILERSASLDDQRKMNAELFNNKFIALGFSTLFLTVSRGLTLDQFVDLDFMFQLASFDAGIVVWKEKARYNAVRPWTAVRVVYGNRRVRAWGGPGKGTVNDMPASEWEPYLSTADHPEYPSGSACFCSAHAQTGRRFFGSDDLGWSFTFPKGSSSVEPGVTPAADITLSYPTWTYWVDRCKNSRQDAGVHFRAAVDASETACKPVGDLAYDFVQRHVNGSN